MKISQENLWNIINSTLITLLFIWIKFFRDKELLKHESKISNISSLKEKLHERLTRIEEAIDSKRRLDKKTIHSIKTNSERIKEHDPKLAYELQKVVQDWQSTFIYSEKESMYLYDNENHKKNKGDLLKRIQDARGRLNKL